MHIYRLVFMFTSNGNLDEAFIPMKLPNLRVRNTFD